MLIRVETRSMFVRRIKRARRKRLKRNEREEAKRKENRSAVARTHFLHPFGLYRTRSLTQFLLSELGCRHRIVINTDRKKKGT